MQVLYDEKIAQLNYHANDNEVVDTLETLSEVTRDRMESDASKETRMYIFLAPNFRVLARTVIAPFKMVFVIVDFPN